MVRGRTVSLSLLGLVLALTNTGCVLGALLDAGGRELNDHGDYARYENKSYGRHFADSLLEPDDDDDCD